jgi:PAS domain S-box-containing protein
MAERRPFDIDGLLAGLGSAVLGSIRDPFAIVAPDYTVLWLNKGMGFIHGSRHEDAVGKICYQFFYERQQACEDCPLHDVFTKGRIQITERGMDFPDGARRWGEVKAYPIRSEDQSVEAAFVIVFDITTHKKASETQKEYTKYLSKKLDAQSGKEQTVYLDDGDIAIKTSLTSREKDVLRLLAEGYTNIQVSEMLAISPHTVKSYVISIFNKLGVSDRTQAAVLAIRHNLV